MMEGVAPGRSRDRPACRWTRYQRDVGHEVHEMRNGKEQRIFSLDLDKSVVLQRTCNIIIDGCYQKEGELRLV